MEATKTEVKNRLGHVLRAAFIEPVIITAHGQPSHVIVAIEQWEEMLQKIKDASPDAENTRQSEDTTT